MATIRPGPPQPDVRRAASYSRPSNVIQLNQRPKPTPQAALVQARVGVIKIANPKRADQEAKAAALRLIAAVGDSRVFQVEERTAVWDFLKAGLATMAASGDLAGAKLGIEVISSAVGRV